VAARSSLSACIVLVAACLVDIPDPPGQSAQGSGGSSATTTASNAGGATSSTTASAGGGPSGYREAVLADNPVGYWRLNETNFPDVFDTSGNNLNGVYVNNVDLEVTGALANDSDPAVKFDGASWADLGDVLPFDMKAKFTLEAWILPDAADPDGGILGKAVYDMSMGGYAGYLWVVINGKLRLHRSAWGVGDGNDTMASVSTAAFTHIVTTYDGITIRHYLNGAMENASAGDAVIPVIPDPLLIGRVEGWGNFKGVIDEVAIYDVVLPEARIQAHYEIGAGLR